ncbi:MAG TPA: NifU family protein [Nocardioidaceae bacterium]|nr:NifU family protein [Nocardioidaceae bacterium]
MAGTPQAGASPEAGPPDLRAVGDRIDALLDASASGGVVARERSEELVRLVADLYGAGIERILEILHDAGRLDEDVLAQLADDDLVASILIVHGLHPYGVEQRVEDALEKVRPYLGSHGGDVELLEVTNRGVVRLRLLGSCDGCPSSSVTLNLAVEGAIEAAAPEVTTIEVETRGEEPRSPLIPAESLMSHLREKDPGGSWEAVPELSLLNPGGVVAAEVQQTSVMGCRVGDDLYAFSSRCPRCESDLASARLARRLGGDRHDALLTCPSCQAHFDVRRAGACLDDPELHLDPLPLLSNDGVVSVAVPRPVA